MDTIHLFNDTVDYIESTLNEEIDDKKISTLSGYSYSMFARIFSMLTGYTLSEYIRYRKLTKSAVKLRDTSDKIIDIALEYGYESSDSFTFAFKKFHGYTPSDVRCGKPFKIFSPIRLSLTIKGGESMKTRIERKEGFKVAGVSKSASKSTMFNEIWEDLFKKADINTLISLGNGMCYGACYEHESFNMDINFKYMAGFDVNDTEKAKSLGLEILDVTPAEYAIVSMKGKMPEIIHDAWKYILQDFFPMQGYRHAGTPDFEVYPKQNMGSENYEMELWVPIEKI